MHIVFMGTPGFAVASLKKLHKSSHEIVAVVTIPDRSGGRGKKIQQSAVKQYAIEQSLPLLQPEKLKSEVFISELKSLRPDLIAVVAFRMLSKIVWSMPAKGTINLHASLLPQYRGAAPINWAIINGEIETGITTFFVNENIDAGAIISSVRVNIIPDETAGTLHDKLMTLGAELLLKTVGDIEANKHNPILQTGVKNLKSAPKIFKEDAKIDFKMSAKQVYNKVRGLSPYPGAFCNLVEGKKSTSIKIYSTTIIEKSKNELPGTISTDNKSYWRVACNDSWLQLNELQLPGRNRMKVKELLNGYYLSREVKMN